MASEILTLSDDNVLCEYIPLPGIKGFAAERVAVGPDLLALLIRDGKIAHATHGAHIQVGGAWQAIKTAIGGSHAIRLLVADLKPFSVSDTFAALSRDNVRVTGEVTVELQINPEKAANVLAFASDHEIVTKVAVAERLTPHIGDRVLQQAVREVDALALRGDAAVQDRVQALMMQEAERVFGDMGLMVRAASINWAVNEEEIAAMEQRAEARKQEMLDTKLASLQREIKRAAAVTTLQIGTEADIETLKATNDHELRRLVLDQEAEFVDAQETAARIQRMKALEGEIAQIQLEQQAKFDIALNEAKSEVEVKRIRVEATKLDLEIERLTRTQRTELHRLEQMNELAIAREAHEANAAKLTDLQKIELEGKKGNVEIDIIKDDAAHSRTMERERLRIEADQAKLAQQRDLTPDQLLAIQAGLSPEVAAVFSERAKHDTQSNAEKMALMERLVESGAKTGEQAKFYFEQFKEGVVGVAAGASGKADGRKATILCPQCRAENPADAAFCMGCSGSLRA